MVSENLYPNLIPNHMRTPEERRANASKAGSTKSENRKIAARLRELKKKGMTDDTYKRLYDMATDSDSSALDIMLFLEKWKKELAKPMEAVQMANAMISLHKAKFGEIQKQQIQQSTQNLNVNVNMDLMKFQDLLKKYDPDNNSQTTPSGQ
jgi:hypothetical protein